MYRAAGQDVFRVSPQRNRRSHDKNSNCRPLGAVFTKPERGVNEFKDSVWSNNNGAIVKILFSCVNEPLFDGLKRVANFEEGGPTLKMCNCMHIKLSFYPQG